MEKAKDWFSNLSTKAKYFLVGAVSILAISAFAEEPAPEPLIETNPAPVQEVKEAVVNVVEVTETEIIKFKTKSKDASWLAAGKKQTETEGRNGVRTIVYEVTYTDGVETERQEISNKVTTQPVTKVVLLGTYVEPEPSTPPSVGSGCDPNYSGGCVPIVDYDLNCADIGFSVVVVGVDIHGFDGRDNDGLGCESY